MIKVGKVAKAVVAAVVAGATALNVAFGDGGFDTTDAITVVLAALGALGVYAVPNSPRAAGR